MLLTVPRSEGVEPLRRELGDFRCLAGASVFGGVSAMRCHTPDELSQNRQAYDMEQLPCGRHGYGDMIMQIG